MATLEQAIAVKVGELNRSLSTMRRKDYEATVAVVSSAGRCPAIKPRVEAYVVHDTAERLNGLLREAEEAGGKGSFRRGPGRQPTVVVRSSVDGPTTVEVKLRYPDVQVYSNGKLKSR